MISFQSVYKKYGNTPALSSFDWNIEGGETWALLGPNGSGKTTILKLLLGIFPCDQGEIRVATKAPGSQEIKKKIGYLPELQALHVHLRVIEELSFWGELYGISSLERKNRIEESCRKTGCYSVLHRKISTLSHGFRQRVSLARSILHAPEILLLDEPFQGLDPMERRSMMEMIQKLQGTVIIATHQLDGISSLCDRLAVLEKGKMLSAGNLEKLCSDVSEEENLWCYQISGHRGDCDDFLREHGILSSALWIGTEKKGSVNFLGKMSELDVFRQSLKEKGIRLLSVRRLEENLEGLLLFLFQKKKGEGI